MKLYAVTVEGVHPVQCVVVWEREESARKLSEHLNATVAPETRVQMVDSFFPRGMTEADSAWLAATDSYLRGTHHNTSGNPA